MNFGHSVARTGRPLCLMLLAILLCAGCSRKPDSALVPPGPPMSPAQADASRVQAINNDSRLTPQQKQEAVERLHGQYSPPRPTHP